jgi:multidrug efflux pump subunit AcrB
MKYDMFVRRSLLRPVSVVLSVMGVFLFSLGLYPFLGLAFFPRTDPGQFVVNVNAPTGTRLELTDQYIAGRGRYSFGHSTGRPRHDCVEYRDHSRFFGFYTSNSAQHTAFVQVNPKKEHSRSSFEYLQRMRGKLRDDLPEHSTYFQTSGLVDAA